MHRPSSESGGQMRQGGAVACMPLAMSMDRSVFIYVLYTEKHCCVSGEHLKPDSQ